MGYLLFLLLMLYTVFIGKDEYLNNLAVQDPEKAERHKVILEEYWGLLVLIAPIFWPMSVFNALRRI